MEAIVALRAHETTYQQENEAAWHDKQDELEAEFMCSRARHLGDLVRKMNFILWEDKLSASGAYNGMVSVMAQLERWA